MIFPNKQLYQSVPLYPSTPINNSFILLAVLQRHTRCPITPLYNNTKLYYTKVFVHYTVPYKSMNIKVQRHTKANHCTLTNNPRYFTLSHTINGNHGTKAHKSQPLYFHHNQIH